MDSNLGLSIPVAGASLGLASVVLWRGKRTFWPRVGAIGCSIHALSIPTWNFNAYYPYYPKVPLLFFERLFADYLPLIEWAFALLFFSVVARKRSAPIHP